jgi:hypothetical protein
MLLLPIRTKEAFRQMASFDDLIEMFRALVTGDVSHDEALVIAKSYPDEARETFPHVLYEVQKSRNPSANDGCKLMQVMWEIDGPTVCLARHFINVQERYLVTFLVDQLRQNPNQFTENDLAGLTIYLGPPEILNAVRLARRVRVKQEAQKLLSNPRELNQDLTRVKERISAYNFSPGLNDALEKVDEEFGKGDGFDQSAMIKHLRTFFEKLHAEVATKFHEAMPAMKDGTKLTECQNVIDFLQRKDVISAKTQRLGRALYAILSEKGVHALESTREYVRLCRNMVVEYGLIVFYEFERRLAE